MSNDRQDDKNKDDKAGTQLYSGAQVKNVINNITNRINAFNPAELQQLKSSAQSISTVEIDSKLVDEIKALIKSIITKEEEDKYNQIAQTIAENQRIADEHAQAQLWKEEMLRFMETQAVYSNFNSISTEYLKQQKERNANLNEALEVTKSGGELSKELKAKLERKSKDIEEEKEKWEKIRKARITAHNEHAHHSNEIGKIDKELPILDQTIHTDKIIFLKQKKDFHIEQREAAKTKIKETTKHYEERQKEATNIMKGQELAKNPDIKSFWADQAKTFNNIHGVHPDNVQLSIEVLEKADKIRQSAEQGKDIGQNNPRTDAQVGKEVELRKQNKVNNNGNDKGLVKTDKKTKQWSI